MCFGGDYATVENVVGHAELARRGLQGALEDLLAADWLTLEEALGPRAAAHAPKRRAHLLQPGPHEASGSAEVSTTELPGPAHPQAIERHDPSP